MAATPNLTRITVCDAGPLIHLDELDCCDLMEGMGQILIPQVVWSEAGRHRPGLLPGQFANSEIILSSSSSDPELHAIFRMFDLDAGERSALNLMASRKANLFLTDDAAARLVGEKLGYAVRGTIGLIVRAIRSGKREVREVREILLSIPSKSSLHLSRALLQKVLLQLPVE